MRPSFRFVVSALSRKIRQGQAHDGQIRQSSGLLIFIVLFFLEQGSSPNTPQDCPAKTPYSSKKWTHPANDPTPTPAYLPRAAEDAKGIGKGAKRCEKQRGRQHAVPGRCRTAIAAQKQCSGWLSTHGMLLNCRRVDSLPSNEERLRNGRTYDKKIRALLGEVERNVSHYSKTCNSNLSNFFSKSALMEEAGTE